MIANISPASSCCEHTLNTLRYADRVKELKSSGGGAKTMTKEDKLSKELMLARQAGNTRQVKIDQRTGQRLPERKPVSDKPTLKAGSGGLKIGGGSGIVPKSMI